ncbi:MAG: hypothetical protein U0T73_03650 [Chitinophagales bacterium]
MQFKTAIFELSGTLIYDGREDIQAAIRAFRSQGFSVEPHVIVPMLPASFQQHCDHILSTQFIVLDLPVRQELVRKITAQFHLELIHHYRYNPEIYAVPHAEYLLDMMRKKGIQIWVVGGFNQEVYLEVTRKFQWLDKPYIQFLSFFDLDQHRKSKDRNAPSLQLKNTAYFTTSSMPQSRLADLGVVFELQGSNSKASSSGNIRRIGDLLEASRFL